MVWVIEGPFDGKDSGKLDVIKSKLLKCNREYLLGRKTNGANSLIISHPKVSAQHITFKVGPHSIEDVQDVEKKPTLLVHNLKSKPIRIERKGVLLAVESSTEKELEDGDTVSPVSGVHVKIRWRRVTVFIPPNNPPVPYDKCAELGIKALSSHHPDITHHLTPSLSPTLSIAISLLTVSQLVRPDWLVEYLRLGETIKDASEGSPTLTMIEYDFTPPQETKHKPSFSQLLPSKFKVFNTWEPNEERTGLFRGWRFVLVTAQGHEIDSEIRELIEKGEGEYDTYDSSNGLERLKQTLTKSKRKAESGKGISVVTDISALKMTLGDQYGESEGILKSLGLQFVEKSQLVDAVIAVDTSKIDSAVSINAAEVAGPSSEAVSNAKPEESRQENVTAPAVDGESRSGGTGEASATIPNRPRLLRRARPASRAPSPVSDMPPPANLPNKTGDEPSAPPPRPKLLRRARPAATNPILGVDDPSIIESQPPGESNAAPVPSVENGQSVAPVSPPKPIRLKRRARTQAPEDSILQGLDKEGSIDEAPPTKKFKALFDETNPDRESALAPGTQFMSGAGIGTQIYSQTQTQAHSEGSNAKNDPPERRLQAVPEESEESQQVSNEDVNMANAVADETTSNETIPSTLTSASARPSSKAPGPSSTQLPAVTQTASSKPGAVPGQPDKDEEFLKALASSKRGKKKEDDFDREFNNLRISKPEKERDDQAKEWALLDDFETNNNLMGNFMVIVEMDVPEKRAGRLNREDREEWSGKPDFKKFKKKSQTRERPPVELVVDENDYGMGSTYWKGGLQTQSQSQGQSQADSTTFLQPSQTQNKTFFQRFSKPPSDSKTQIRTEITESKRGKRATSRAVESEDDSPPPPTFGRRKAANGTQIKKQSQTQKLFLDDEDEDEEVPKSTIGDDDENFDLNVGGSDDDEDELPRRSTKPSSSRTKAKTTSRRAKRPAELLDDDSDNGGAFKGFSGRKKART